MTTPIPGYGITLEPLHVGHAEALLKAAGDPDTFRWFTLPPETWDEAGFAGYAQQLIEHPAIEPFAVRLDTGEIVGSTTYCDIRPEHRGVEIGWTWYAPDHRGTHLNPACKLMLLRNAFETEFFAKGPAIRVQLKTDARNERSRAAILKLGATFEGIHRQHVVMPDGFYRATAMYSILDGEWPRVKAGLEARLTV